MPDSDFMTSTPLRDIIQDFADDIKKRKLEDTTPSKVVIPFRNEHRTNKERDVVTVPIEILRFRKENGRIISNVKNYEQEHGILKENSDATQVELRKFLSEKDPEKTKELINSIRSSGQRDPAVITCDGFLINGNRRKVAIDKLYEDTREDEYSRMKVVILPGKDDPGGPPTKKEIEQIENRYQLQSDGKSEYTRLDQAISIRHKRDNGMSLKEILKDDPNYTHAEAKKLKQAEKDYEKNLLGPLQCVDDYLHTLGRDGLYENISTGHGDKLGKWQAFADYYGYVKIKLENEKNRNKFFDIEEGEIGKIEEIAFKMIRKHEFKKISKIHDLMRALPSMIKHPEARKELYHLLKIDWELDQSESGIEDDSTVSERDKDLLWGNKNAQEFLHRVKKAKRNVDYKKEKDTPITLLMAAKTKLQHEEMNVSSVDLNDLKTLMQLCRDIAKLSNEIESEAYHIDTKSLDALKKKFSS